MPEDKDNINAVQQLSREATAVNQSFAQQVLQADGPTYDCGQPNPFPTDAKEPPSNNAYRCLPPAILPLGSRIHSH